MAESEFYAWTENLYQLTSTRRRHENVPREVTWGRAGRGGSSTTQINVESPSCVSSEPICIHLELYQPSYTACTDYTLYLQPDSNWTELNWAGFRPNKMEQNGRELRKIIIYWFKIIRPSVDEIRYKRFIFSICELREIWRRESRTFLTDVHEITFRRVPWSHMIFLKQKMPC
jgi:hypothetical protein